MIPARNALGGKMPGLIRASWLFCALTLLTITRAVYGNDMALTLNGEKILVNAKFIDVDPYGSYFPQLTCELRNKTSFPWRTLKILFGVGALCKGEARQWTLPITTSLGWSENHEVVKEYREAVMPLLSEVDGCHVEVITARLLFAESFTTRIEGAEAERVDFEKRLQEIKVKLEADAAAQAEQKRKAAEVQAKKDAVEDARRERLAAERKRKQAEEDAQAAEQRRKIRASCAVIYKNTVNKKVSDLTVGEVQQVQACQAVGFYPPQ